jgi:hypothetical protein
LREINGFSLAPAAEIGDSSGWRDLKPWNRA